MVFLITILLSLHVVGVIYIAWRLSSLHFTRPLFLYLFIAFAAVLSFCSFFARKIPSLNFIAPIGYVCLGAWSITFSFFVLGDIVSLANLFLKIKNFRYYLTLIIAALSLLAVIYSFVNANFILNIKEVKIKVPKLSVNNLKIVLLSDIHINGSTNPKSIIEIFNKVAMLEPDIIAIAGDVIDVDIDEENKFLDYGFSKLKAKYGVFAVSGNHEYYTGIDSYFSMLEKLDFKALQNKSVEVENIINVAGINDIDFNNLSLIEKSLEKTNPNLPVLFLSHRPESFDIASKQNMKIIQLSGHTHAGQIPPISWIRKYFMKYYYGLYQENDSVMYLTSGTRWWGPQMRFFNSCEIVVILLEKE